MSEVAKPRNLTVQDFVQHFSHLNDMIEYAPVPNPINNLEVQTPKFTDSELARIVTNVCPAAGWKKAQIHANLHHLSLAAQTRYYTGLGNIEPNENASHQSKIQETKTSHQRKGKHSAHKIKPNKPLNQNQKYCEIHGKCNPSSSQCDMIRKQCEEYKSTTNNKNKKSLTVQSIIPDHIHAKSRNRIIP
jgi:hypothetical protein